MRSFAVRSVVLLAALLCASCAARLDGTSQGAFDHSVNVALRSKDDLEKTTFQLRLATANLKLGSANVRRALDDKTLDEANEYLNANLH